jgi:hypothetical protein
MGSPRRKFLGYDAAIRLAVVAKRYSTMRLSVSKTLRIVGGVASIWRHDWGSHEHVGRGGLGATARPLGAGTCAPPGCLAAPAGDGNTNGPVKLLGRTGSVA